MTYGPAAKLIKSLQKKKYREDMKKFMVEGTKNVEELLASDFRIEFVYATKEFEKSHHKILEQKKLRVQIVEGSELVALGTLAQNDGALAVVFQKEQTEVPQNGMTLVLDDVRDPGNLGTLIRIADWYGISQIVCSPNCVDWYNPKVISATMGSFTRVSPFYTELVDYLKQQTVPVIGGFLNGESTHTFSFPKEGILVIGSESHGISKEVAKFVTHKVTIPKFGKAESLNAAVAGAIILDRWKGNQ
jgi:TrmH family RNA methyltransferase